MNKTTKISIAVLSLILIVLIALPFAINKSAIKFQIEQKISQKLGVNFEAKGKVGIRFLPILQISLGDATANNLVMDNEYYSNISIANLIIRPEIFSLFSGKVKIDSLIFQNPKIENRYVNVIQIIDEQKKPILKADNIDDEFFKKMLNFQDSGQEIFDFKNIKSIKFRDGTFSKKNSNNNNTLEFTKINFVLKNQLNKQIFTVQGDFISDDTPTDFKLVANIKNSDDSILTIQSPIVNFIANGNFINSNINDLIKSNFSGRIDAEIINLKAFLNKYFSKDNPICLKINASQPIKVSAEINNDNGKITAENILIKSQIIDGGGKVSANLADDKPKVNANFSFNNIDIDSIWFSGSLNSDSKTIDSENDIIKKFISDAKVDISDKNKSRIIDATTSQKPSSKQSVLDNLDLTANIKIKTAKYYDGNLKDLSLAFFTSNNSKIILKPFRATIPGGSFKANGTLEYDNNIPKFIGKVEIIGGDLSKSLSWLKININSLKPNILSQYNFTADLITLPNFTFFDNLNLTINDNKNIIVGNLKIDDSTAISLSSANLRVEYLNYDDYFSTNKRSPYLLPGSLLNKLLWLNTMNSNRNIYLIFDQLLYQGDILSNQAFRIQFGQGYLKLSDIDIHSPTLDIKGNIAVDINNINPKFNLNINSDNFQYISTENSMGDQLFNLPSLNDFSGKVNLNITNLKLNSWQASEVSIAGKLTNGVIDFDNFNLKTYNGTAKYNGSMVCKNIKTVLGSVELIEIDNNQFLSDLFGVNNISGITNISATIGSSGGNRAEFINNIDAKAEFISANINVKGFGIYDLAAKMAQPQKYQKELAQPLKILYGKTARSSFRDASGAAEFKRGRTKNLFNIKVGTSGINGVISGTIDNEQSFDGNGNFIFISGNRTKRIPLNFAANFNGKSGEIKQNTNLSQIEQYLGLLQTSPTNTQIPKINKTPNNDNQFSINNSQSITQPNNTTEQLIEQ